MTDPIYPMGQDAIAAAWYTLVSVGIIAAMIVASLAVILAGRIGHRDDS